MKIRNILITIILVMILSITVGFSAFVSEMSISNIVADVRVEKDIRITDVSFVSEESYNVNPSELDFDDDSLVGEIVFNNTDSYATYVITVTNFGNVDMNIGGRQRTGNVYDEGIDGFFENVSALGGTHELIVMITPLDFVAGQAESFKIDIEFNRIYNVLYENLAFDTTTIVEGNTHSVFIGEDLANDVEVYMNDVLTDDYFIENGQLVVHNVTGNLLIKGPKTLNSVMRLNSVLDTNVSFVYSSGLEVENNITYTRNGTQNDEYPIYYYRGNVTANNVLFGNYCWKMVRTTDTGGVKMIYNGVPATDGSCNNTKTASQIGTGQFNPTGSSPTYVGYMYGKVYEISAKSMGTDTYVYGNDVTWDGTNYTLVDTMTSSSWATDYKTLSTKYHYTCFNDTGTCENISYISNFIYTTIAYSITFSNGETLEEAKEAMFSNETDSVIKTKIDNWYKTNMIAYTSLLEDTIWCNDRTISSGVLLSKDTSKTGGSKFISDARASSGAISLACPNKRDSFTVDRTDGNGKLTYPVGLLTADELTLAGSGYHAYNKLSYLNSGEYYWGMAPSHVDTGDVYVFGGSASGGMMGGNPSSSFGVRPSISLKTGSIVAGGDGTVTNPYRVKSTFTINDKIYYYEPGMTWSEWLNSSYNTSEIIEYNGVPYNGDSQVKQVSSVDEKIDNGIIYNSYIVTTHGGGSN